MKTYIGTKIIEAEPMTFGTFCQMNPPPSVQLPDTDEGYVVRYAGGYVSWSPKYVFERAYREITLEERQLL